MSEEMFPLRDEQFKAESANIVRSTQEIPRNYYQRPDGLIAPERLKNPEPEITICGNVDEEMFKETSKSLQKIVEGNTVINGLRVNFSSFGGEVATGFGIHDLLVVFGREHNIPVTVTGYGPIMSTGALIIQAGDIRRMPKNSRMLLHPVKSSLYDDVQRLEYRVQETRALQMIYSEIVSERVRRTGKEMSPEDVTRLMEANNGVGTYMTSEEALELGLIDEVI